jgi:hypothetical protein
VVGILVEHDFIAVPIPIVNVGHVIGRDTEVVAIKPEAIGAAALHAPAMLGTESTFETAVLPRVSQAVMLIIRPSIVAHPPAVIHMRRVRMAGSVGVIWATLLVSTVILSAGILTALLSIILAALCSSAAWLGTPRRGLVLCASAIAAPLVILLSTILAAVVLCQ